MIGTSAASRVKLKNHVYFGMVPDGVLFDAGDTSFVLKDKSAYPLVEKLIALIDGGNSVPAILEHAPSKLAAFFQRILALLGEHGMLLTLDDDAPAAQHLATHSALNELRKFLEDRLDGHAVGPALRRWREAHVVVMGAGHALLAAVRALADSGCTRLTVVADGRATDGLDELRDDIEATHLFRFAARSTLDGEHLADAAGMLVYASDDDVLKPVLASVLRIEHAMQTNAIPGAIGAVFDGRACVLPAAHSGHPGVTDLQHWLAPQEGEVASLGPVAMALLGCVAAQAALCRFFGVEAAATGGQAAIISPSLEVDYSMLVACASTTCGPAPLIHPSRYQAPERHLMPFEQVKYALEPWFDPLLGPFRIVADDAIEQVPLLQYPIRVRPAAAGAREEIVVGWGLEHAGAVIHGLSQAIEALAHTFGQDGAAPVCEFDEASWKRRALAYAVAHSDDLAQHHHWAWVDLEQLPSGPARVLHALLRFHAPNGVRVQLQWSDAGDAFVVRVLRADALLCSVVAADPLAALTEGLGQVCSMFQLQQFGALRFGRNLALRAPAPDAQVADWQDALSAAETAQARPARPAEFHLLRAPGFPPAVYCGHATLPARAGMP